jgi:small subunit ribosomal protein S21
MAIRIKARSGEGTDQMMRRFKKLCEKEGLTKDIRRKEFYEKPSERNRRNARKAVARRMRELGLFTPKTRTRGPGGPGGPGGRDSDGPGPR